MTTKLTVTSGNNGTLKLNKSLGRRLMRLTTSLFFAGLAFAAMSFTQDDTTKNTDDKVDSRSVAVTNDSCCVVTFINGVQRVVITSKNAFTADVRINDMDLKTWVNSMMAYSYKKINYGSIGSADNTMDAAFTNAEMINYKKAVAYSKKMETQVAGADAEINGIFTETVEAPLFISGIAAQAADADALMDKSLNDDAENRIKAALFGKAIEKAGADQNMDYMVYARDLLNVSPATGSAADQHMDDLLAKNSFKNIRPTAVVDADKVMDDLLQKGK